MGKTQEFIPRSLPNELNKNSIQEFILISYPKSVQESVQEFYPEELPKKPHKELHQEATQEF